MHRWLPFVLLGLSIQGCCRSSSPPPGQSTGATEEPESAATTETTAAAEASAAPAASAGTDRPSQDGLPSDIPMTRSPMPGMREWEATTPLNVRSAVAQGCQVSMLREWVRVVCNGPRRSGGALEGVEVKGGCSTDTHAAMRRQATLLTALSPGNRCEVTFRWADGASLFVADWPRRSRPSLNFVSGPDPAGSAPGGRRLNPQLPVRRLNPMNPGAIRV